MAKKYDPNDHQPTGDCNTCGLHKSMSSKWKGVRVPNGYGKCLCPGGHCNPQRAFGEADDGSGSGWYPKKPVKGEADSAKSE